MSLGSRLRRVWRIARWEASLGSTGLDRRTLLVAAGLLVLAGGIVAAGLVVGVGGLSPNQDIYRVGVAADSPYYDVVERDASLRPREPDRTKLETGEIDLLVTQRTSGGTVSLIAEDDPSGPVDIGTVGPSTVSVAYAPTEKGSAALTAFRSAVQSYNDRTMALEPNETAAYPVTVRLQYRTQGSLGPGSINDAVGGGDTGGTDGDGGTTGGGGADDGSTDGSQQDGGSTDDGSTDEGSTDGGSSGGETGDREDPQLADDDGGLLDGLLAGGSSQGSPAEISPPFPFGSLILAFVFLVPMNFIIQAYGGTILNERINRRGELLLVAPVERLDIVAGKTLPYLTAAVVAISAISYGVGGGVVAVAAVLPIALAFLASTFVGAMFARSFKELTFVTVTVSVFLTSYVFVPAIFTNVTPIALISPLTIVVMSLQGEAVGIGGYVFSTAPFYLGSTILFLLGVGVYREEDMFTQKPVPLKFLDALDARLRGPKSVAVVSALTIPFVFIAELLAIAVLFIMPVEISVPLILVVIAAIEEVAKSIHLYAGFESDRFDRSTRTALLIGVLSGVGFFVGEKFTAIAQVVGLPELVLGQATLTPSGVTPTATLALLLGPLVLHTVTAAISSLGARRNFRWYLLGMLVATAVHAAYNFAVVTTYA